MKQPILTTRTLMTKFTADTIANGLVGLALGIAIPELTGLNIVEHTTGFLVIATVIVLPLTYYIHKDNTCNSEQSLQ